MCGIAGKIHFDNQEVTRNAMGVLCDRLAQRGPDGHGIYIDGSVGLGHRRLSIIDLKTGHQPMVCPDLKAVLVFNGEIYNFVLLKSELIRLGASFSTESDTEVVLTGYRYWGIDKLLKKLEGMFAFAIYDREKGQIVVARDKFGEKPLFYSLTGDALIFASELKAIVPELSSLSINKTALNMFLSLTYIPAPYTIYDGVHKLGAGHYMTVTLEGKMDLTQYYSLQDVIVKGKSGEQDIEEAKHDLRHLLTESIVKRMIADVPLGAFLSGGLDSSIVTAIMAEESQSPVQTYSIGFVEKEYDESNRAQLMAAHIGSQHHVHMLDYKDVVHEIDDIIAYFDEPFGDSSAIPSCYVARLASRDVKVVLTGDCADELFGGYEKYLANYYRDKFLNLPVWLQHTIRRVTEWMPHTRLTNAVLRRIKKVLSSTELSDFDLHYQYMCLGFSDEERRHLLKDAYWTDIKTGIGEIYDQLPDADVLTKGWYTDVKIVLEGDMLVKVDRMCMKNGLEARVPFLDSKIVEAAFRMPASFKIRGRSKKYILKETFKKILPAETLRFRKKGFGVPVDYWFNNQLKEALDDVCSKAFIEKQGLFSYQVIHRLVEEHRSGKQNHKGKLWNIFVFQKWYLNQYGSAENN